VQIRLLRRNLSTVRRGANQSASILPSSIPTSWSPSPMRLPLIPREEKFYEMFVEDASNVLAGSRLLQEFFRNFDERERLALQLRNTEHEGDRISHEIGRKLEATFVTPFDREEIHALISRLDDIIDLIEEVADTCILYGVREPSDTAAKQAEIIALQCEQIVDALARLRGFKGLERYWIEVHRLENEGDRIARQAVAELFKHDSDPVEIIKWKDIYGLLEDTIDACEDAANVIERIVVKHA
jgi:predicted phosphate transport protein (TIGR00153 family)